MPFALQVIPGRVWSSSDEEVDATALNQTATPQVQIPDSAKLPPEFIDVPALASEMDGAVNPQNFVRRSAFWGTEWLNPAELACPAGVLTENAFEWFTRPTGATVKCARTESAPDTATVYAAQIIGATGCTAVDFATWIPSAIAGELRGETLTFSMWVKNVTGASINVSVFVACPGVIDGMADAVDGAVSAVPTAIANGEWGRVTYTFNAADIATFLNGALIGLRFGGVLTTSLKSVECTQAQLQRGGAATAWLRPTLPPLPRDGDVIYPDSALDTTAAPFDLVLQDRYTGAMHYLAPPPVIFATPYLTYDAVTRRPVWRDLTGNKFVFGYTGLDQVVTVPAGATSMTVHAWGGGGSNDAPSDAGVVKGGVGGYAKGVFAVVAGTQYAVVVGEGAHALARRAYGFGGAGQGAVHNHNGGGLSGVFTSTTPVTETDFARALVIAAGGGSAGQSGGGASAAQGGNGGDPARSGTTGNFQGVDATGGVGSGNGGGGGGRYGGQGIGLGGKGGTSFVHTNATPNGGAHAKATVDELAYAAFPSLIVPKSTLTEYVGDAGQSGRNGLVVIIFA